MYTSYLAFAGNDEFRVFDTDYPDGGLARYHPENSEVVDLTKTTGQVTLFDTMMGDPGRTYVIDLQASLLRKFFTIFKDIEFDTEIEKLGSRVVVFFILDKTIKSIAATNEIRSFLKASDFFVVDNAAIGTAIETLPPDLQGEFLKMDRKIVIPEFSKELLALLEDPDFELFRFIAGKSKSIPYELYLELWNVLDMLYEQRSPDSQGVTHQI